VGKTGGDSERLIQTFSALELFEVGVVQSLQMAHLATLRQLQRPDLSRMFGEVNYYLSSVLPRFNRTDRSIVSNA